MRLFKKKRKLTDLEMVNLIADDVGMGMTTEDYRKRMMEVWNPLKEHKIAFGLIEHYGLQILPRERHNWYVLYAQPGEPWAQSHGRDLRRCIVECVAKMLAKKNGNNN